MLAFLKKLFFALCLFVLLIFVYQNLEALGTNVPFVFDAYFQGYRYQTPPFPVWILFALFFLFGMLAAGFHGIYERLARRVEIRKRDKRIRELEKELGELRAQAAELKPPVLAEEPAPGEPSPAEAAQPTRALPPGREAPSRRPAAPTPRPLEEEPTL
jgi:uncharacterized integral membrane protein